MVIRNVNPYSDLATLRGTDESLELHSAAFALDARSHEANDDNVRRDVSRLPGMLDRIDDWISEGVLGGEELNAADFQIAPSLRLAMSLDDLRPAIENRPAGELALRVVPNCPGRTPPVLPRAWLEPLRVSPA